MSRRWLKSARNCENSCTLELTWIFGGAIGVIVTNKQIGVKIERIVHHGVDGRLRKLTTPILPMVS